MRKRLRRYFEAYLTQKSAAVEADIFHDLSPELQQKVGEYVLHEDVKHNPLFDGVPTGVVVRLQCIVQKAMVEARHRVTIAGQAGTAMYVIVSGTARMEMDLPEKKTSRLLGGGDSFGEEILLRFAEQYEYTTTATERMQLQMILVEEFMQLFSNMPNIVDR